jgi:hypothetical protein
MNQLCYPVLLGAGKRFFSDSADPRELALVSTQATPTGVLMTRIATLDRCEAKRRRLVNHEPI